MEATTLHERLSRRDLLGLAGSALAAGAAVPLASAGAAPPAAAGEPASPGSARTAPLPISLNSATVRGRKLGAARVLELAAAAGFAGVELWIDEIDEHVRSGGTLADLGKRARDLGLALPNAIGFFEWLVDDDARRARAVEDARRRMDALARIGCSRIAAPPAGNVAGVDLLRAAERYRALLEIGDGLGVVPVVEIWGGSPALSRLGHAAMVVLEAGHPKACMLPDVFHLHKGGSDFGGIRFLAGAAIGILHLNDYPAQPPRADLKDSHRVFPGDGIAPLVQLLRDLRGIGYPGFVSLELFNPEYYRREPEEVLREGCRKCRAVVEASAG